MAQKNCLKWAKFARVAGPLRNNRAEVVTVMSKSNACFQCILPHILPSIK